VDRAFKCLSCILITARLDRYQHDLDVDTDDTDDSPLFGFSSCSHRYRKSQTRTRLAEESHDAQDSSGTGSDGSVGNPKTEKSKSSSLSNSSSAASKDKTDSLGDPKPSSKVVPPVTISSAIPSSGGGTGEKTKSTLVSQLSTPESSQTESEEISPQIHRRRRTHRECLPRFSISASSVEAIAAEIKSHERSSLKLSDVTDSSFAGLSPLHQSTPTSSKRDGSCRNVVKSASAFGLSLQIPEADSSSPSSALNSTPQAVQSPGGSSTASSRDTSPCRELSPLINSLKPPIILRRGPQGLGFTLRAIRVYFGDSNVYTVQHLVKEVTEGSPAFEAGLRAGDLITQVNGEPTQGLLHTQVLHLLMSGGDQLMLRATPLENTSIRSGGRRREPGQSKMARSPLLKSRKTKKESTEKRRKSLLLKTLAGKRTPAEIQHLRLSLGSASAMIPSRSFQSLCRSVENVQQPSLPGSPTTSRSSQSPPLPRIFSLSDSPNSTANSSPSSSPGSSLPESPATLGPSGLLGPHFQRPSSLHGLKHKLHHHHATSKNIHSPNRRKSVGHIPLSPLARTPSPSPISSSPTRSPSPLAIAGNNNNSSPGLSFASSSSLSPASVTTKKPFNRAKNTEPGSPLLRRALSPDRHHPRTTEAKAISPLCNPAPKVTISSPPKVTITSQPHSSTITKSPLSTNSTSSSSCGPVDLTRRSRKDGRVEPESEIVLKSVTVCASSGGGLISEPPSHPSSTSLSSVTIGLPRIAEERDSPKDDHSGDSQPSSLSETGSTCSSLDNFSSKGNNVVILEKSKTETTKVDNVGRGSSDSGLATISGEIGASSSCKLMKAKCSQVIPKQDEKQNKSLSTKQSPLASESLSLQRPIGIATKVVPPVPATVTKDLNSKKPTKESSSLGLKFTRTEKKSPP